MSAFPDGARRKVTDERLVNTWLSFYVTDRPDALRATRAFRFMDESMRVISQQSVAAC
jgi:hypothetical protein